MSQRTYPSQTVANSITSKTQPISTLRSTKFKHNNPTCLPYLGVQNSALFFTLHTITKKIQNRFVLKRNMHRIMMYAIKLYFHSIQSLRSIKMNVTQTDFQKIKSPYKTTTAMNRWIGKDKYSQLASSKWVLD